MDDAKVFSSSPRTEGESRFGKLEKWGTQFDAVRLWITRAWRIGMLMGKSGYLLSERKQLFKKLGEELYYRIQKGELTVPELEPLVRDIDRLSKKVEVEELRIRGLRFGREEKRRYAKEGDQEPKVLNEV